MILFPRATGPRSLLRSPITMARPLRLEYPGALWHVTNRGVEQRSIYVDDADRVRFLHLIEETTAEYGWRLLAYVLMSNHYHLLFRTPETNLSRGMKDLDGDYASSFNTRHRRVGHLFQGRFKSHLVDSETYLAEVARYIVLNPVRAHIVEMPGEWRWSSYRATAGLATVPKWLDPGPILDLFNAGDWNAATHGYREFVAAAIGLDVSPWEDLRAQTFLGGGKFLQWIEQTVAQRKSSSEHLRDQRGFRATTIDSVRATVTAALRLGQWPPKPGTEARLLFALLAERRTNATHAQIGRLLGITSQGAGHVIQAGLRRSTADPEFAARVAATDDRLGSTEAEL